MVIQSNPAFGAACAQGHWSQTIQTCTKLLKEAQGDEERCCLHCDRALCYMQLDLYKHAIKDLDAALRFTTNGLGPKAFLYKGQALARMGRVAEAIASWEQAKKEMLREDCVVSFDLGLFLQLKQLLEDNSQKAVAPDPVPTLQSSSSISIARSPSQELEHTLQGKCLEEDSGALANRIECSQISGTSREAQGSQATCSIPDSNDSQRRAESESKPAVEQARSSTSQPPPNSETNDKPSKTKPAQSFSGRGKSRTPEKGRGQSSTSSSVKTHEHESDACTAASSVASCSGREQSVRDRAEIRGAISKDPRNERSERWDEQSAKVREAAEKPAKKKGELPPKVNLNGIDLRVATGIEEVNKGNLDEAVAIFDKVLEDDRRNPAALLGRGSAYAMQSSQKGAGRQHYGQKLQDAVADFSELIQIEPRFMDAWKRRGQARAALGKLREAVADLTEALRLGPNSDDAYFERGSCYYKLRDYLKAEADARAILRLKPRNDEGYWLLGRSLISQGECRLGIEQLKQAVKLNPQAKDIYPTIAQAYKEIADFEQATVYFEKALSSGDRSLTTYHLWGMMRYGLGDHRGALDLFNKVLQQDPQNLECKYLKAACLHAIGQYAEAAVEYDSCLNDKLIDGKEDSIVVAYLAFYQREVARYTLAKQWGPLEGFDIDGDLDPAFKEGWCKKLNPATLFSRGYEKSFQQAERVLGGELGEVRARHRRQLLTLADRIGQRIQYNCEGFMKNSRQHRMAGLAALEVAQLVTASWQAMRTSASAKQQEQPLTQGVQSAASPGEPPPESQSRFPVPNSASRATSPKPKKPSATVKGRRKADRNIVSGWREVFDTVAKWRQIVEPCDPVVWVDMLSKEEFAAGFGSHTPLLLGHSKVVRYYPYFPRAFGVMKDLMLERGEVHNARDERIVVQGQERRDAVKTAADCEALYKVIGEDFWIATPCCSIAKPGEVLDGTRLTIQKQRDVEKAYEFSIRTPCTPDRWKKFDKELARAWDAVCTAACNRLEKPNEKECIHRLGDSILDLAFFWYNFMPLCRGTAAVGYVMILGLFLAAGQEVTATIPQGLQVDWEAILTPDVQKFQAAIRPWLYPALRPIDLTGDGESNKGIPRVVDAFPTVQTVVSALGAAESRWRDVERH